MFELTERLSQSRYLYAKTAPPSPGICPSIVSRHFVHLPPTCCIYFDCIHSVRMTSNKLRIGYVPEHFSTPLQYAKKYFGIVKRK